MHTPISGALARFQHAFAQALLSPEAKPGAEIAVLAAQPAFAVYRTVSSKRYHYPNLNRAFVFLRSFTPVHNEPTDDKHQHHEPNDGLYDRWPST